jgi:hypothetical protein
VQQVEAAHETRVDLEHGDLCDDVCLGFGLLLPITSAFSGFADLVGVAAGMVVLGLLFG